MQHEELKNPKERKILGNTVDVMNNFANEEGEVDVKSLASAASKQKKKNELLKKIIIFGFLLLLLMIGLMIGSVV